MDNDLEKLRRLWPYLTDAGREAVVRFAEATAVSNGYEEPSPTVFQVQDKRKVEPELRGVDCHQQRRAMEVHRELFGPGECPF